MPWSRFCLVHAAFVGAVMLAISGCGSSGPPKYVVKGKILDGNSPPVVKMTASKAGGYLRLWLTNDETPPAHHDAVIDFDTGTFVIDGGNNKGIPAGKYKVCVEWFDDYPTGPEKLKGRFNEKNSKVIREVPPPEGELLIDISKPQG